jgi:hypothetical protein
MSVTGTLVFSDRLRGNEYECRRCGICRTFKQDKGRSKPTCCRDCRGVVVAERRGLGGVT